MGKFLTRLSALSSQVARWFAGFGLLLMTAIIVWQVFARYVLNASPSWAEQAALLLMIWYVMFAAAAGVREGFHIRIAVVVDALPAKTRRTAVVLADAVVGLFGAAMAYWGVELAQATWEHVIPTLNLSRGYAYVPIPIAGVLIAGYSIEHIVAELRGGEVTEQWN